MFDKSVTVILGFEGGYVNHANDPGGETKYGISKRSYPDEDIASLTLDRAKDLYLKDYWLPICADQLPNGLDLLVFDCAVNHGVSKASQILQKVLRIKPDGHIGPVTLEAMQGMPVNEIIQAYALARLSEYQLSNVWDTFGKGWSKRLVLVSMMAAFYSKSDLD